MMQPRYRRVLLKLSGESLMGSQSFGIDPIVIRSYAEEVRSIVELGVQVGIVLGGGNIFRGVQAAAAGIDQVSGDHMGMLATVINCIALQNALEALSVPVRLQTAIRMEQVAETFIRRRALRHLEKGRVVIFGAGTGNPYFTTDTAAVLRASEIDADVVLKGTRVDGVYDKDPEKHADAVKFTTISYSDALQRGLRIMDLTAITMAQENKKPIVVFNINGRGNLRKLVTGDDVGSTVL
ncbi:MAG: UMP kinase [Flavobacteriales bacterium]|nr:MAG: UMP kinase [Bacteroidota bacterium]MBE2266262.1 UMP kinase [Flavobacteriales bacterium]MBW7854265.1 UMP kinase [Candidatus Kapabacteria bacterium]MCC6331022.1 UMP kinase [Ignavibacteria bacterium]NOG67546.1 UMP kinase [Chlorobiota bacterium]